MSASRCCLVVGATGYLGSVISEKLLLSGWVVLGTARSPEQAALLQSRGLEAVLCVDGIVDPAVAKAASSCEVVIDVTRGSFKTRSAGAELIIEALSCTTKPSCFVATTGTNFYGHTGFGAMAHEDWPYNPEPMTWEAWSPEQQKTQRAINEWWQRFERTVLRDGAGMRTAIIRPSYVYGRGIGGTWGGLPAQIETAKNRGVALYVGDGSQRIGTVHVDDLADLYVLLVSRSGKWPAGSCFNGCSGLTTRRQVAEAVAAVAGCKCGSWSIEDAQRELGAPSADSLSRENATSGAKAQSVLGWVPSRPGMVLDLLSQPPRL